MELWVACLLKNRQRITMDKRRTRTCTLTSTLAAKRASRTNTTYSRSAPIRISRTRPPFSKIFRLRGTKGRQHKAWIARTPPKNARRREPPTSYLISGVTLRTSMRRFVPTVSLTSRKTTRSIRHTSSRLTHALLTKTPSCRKSRWGHPPARATPITSTLIRAIVRRTFRYTGIGRGQRVLSWRRILPTRLTRNATRGKKCGHARTRHRLALRSRHFRPFLHTHISRRSGRSSCVNSRTR